MRKQLDQLRFDRVYGSADGFEQFVCACFFKMQKNNKILKKDSHFVGWGFSAFRAGMACAIRPIRQCHMALFVKTIKKNIKKARLLN